MPFHVSWNHLQLKYYIHVHIYFSIIQLSPQTYSIEFDRDFDYFAIAGVTKKIKVLL